MGWKQRQSHRAASQLSANRAQCEQILLSHVKTCYDVAFALTHNQRQAQLLAREVLSRAWKNETGAITAPRLKLRLLTELRQLFLAGFHNTSTARAALQSAVS